MKVLVIDGQGGRMGCAIIEQLCSFEGIDITAVGTNSIAAAAMLKAGAKNAATGENPVVVACRSADVIVGPIGIVIADALLGEITPEMACAVAQSPAHKVLLPVNRCNNTIVGAADLPMAELCRLAAKEVLSFSRPSLCVPAERPARS